MASRQPPATRASGCAAQRWIPRGRIAMDAGFLWPMAAGERSRGEGAAARARQDRCEGVWGGLIRGITFGCQLST
eukprot:278426-Chlamydomonas_euryale.AAC.1